MSQQFISNDIFPCFDVFCIIFSLASAAFHYIIGHDGMIESLSIYTNYLIRIKVKIFSQIILVEILVVLFIVP